MGLAAGVPLFMSREWGGFIFGAVTGVTAPAWPSRYGPAEYPLILL
jgi:hypothetical protein